MLWRSKAKQAKAITPARAPKGCRVARSGYVPCVVERVEGRRLFAGFATLDPAGLLTVTGTSGSDTILVRLDPVNSALVQVQLTPQGGATQSQEFTASLVKAVNVSGDPVGQPDTGGGDTIEVDVALPGGSTEQGAGCEITGGAGNDTITGSPGSDVLSGGAGNDSIIGRAGDDTISGGDGNDTLRGGGGNDIVEGDAGNDLVFGGAGNDICSGGPGSDTIHAGKGDDNVAGNGGNDMLFGGPGNDSVDGGNGTNTVIGGVGNDTLSGAGANVMIGDNEDALIPSGDFPADTTPGNDSIIGGPMNDTIISGAGADTLTGGGGSNVYEVTPGATDTFTDFNPSLDSKTSDRVYTGAAAVTKNVRLTINVVEDGVTKNVPIPSTAGHFPGGTSFAQVTATNGDGSSTVTFSANVVRSFILGKFFQQWGMNFSAGGLGRYANTGGSLLSMTVNGANNTQFDQYVVQNGDSIVITYVLNTATF